ncbi:MAG: murein DD-endopeptidase MepM/ murein hydrolase activator NlpD [Bacteroidia bacterium]|jgi:murein DD-endopeptidase MepM/ murein hydrolase activator NlpD
MAKTHYKYNSETLSYDTVKTAWWVKGLRIFGFLSIAFIFSLGIMKASFKYFDSPNERQMRVEMNQQELQILNLKKKLNNLSEEFIVLEKRDEDIYREIFGAPLPESLRASGIGGAKKYEELNGLSLGTSLKDMNIRLDELSRKANIQKTSYKELLKLATQKSKMLASIPAIQPIPNKDLKRMASGYGYRIDPFYKTRKFHAGMDFTAPTGTEVHSTGDGVIEKVEAQRWGYGKSIVVNHGFGYKTRYAHLSKFMVKPGQKVTRGQVIGLVGSTGKSTAPHLHYEVEVNGQKQNPTSFYYNDLTSAQYEEMIELSSHPNQSFD